MILRRATLRLTIRYSLVLLGVVAMFGLGVGLYVSIAFDAELPEASASEEAIDRANSTLHVGMLICFGVLVFLVPILSYLLARSALAPVRAGFEAQQRFVDDASHELRTPLAVAQGELELALMRDRTPQQYQATIRASLSAIEETGQLTSDLLLLTRADHIGADAISISVAEILNRATLSLPEQDQDRVKVRANASETIRCAPELITRAVGNLLENALKFSPPDQHVLLEVSVQSGEVFMTVTDHGGGMDAADAAHCFERFWRADSARSVPGHGIGLSIVQRIAQYHQGHAELHSTLGAGTRASIQFPQQWES